MSETKSAVINVSKALAGVPLAALAWAGGATSIPWLAALLSLPSAILLASDTIGVQVAKLDSQKDEVVRLEISPPDWWTSDYRSWQNVCTEIVDHFPAILQRMSEYMRQEQDAKTMDVVQQVFIEALVLEHLTWASQPEERRKIGTVVASPILQNLGEILDPVIKQIQQEEALKDFRRTAIYSGDTARNTKENTSVLKEIHRALVPPALSNDEMTDLRQQYCQTLHERWKMLDFRGIMHADMNRPISIPLTEVFILPKVLVGVPEYETLEREEDYENNDTNGEEQERLWEEEQERLWEEEQERLEQRGRSQRIDILPILQREDFRTVMAKHRRLVILGDPGSGKSTLLRYLLLQLSQGGEKFTSEFPHFADISHAVPLYLPLASYAEAWLSNVPGTRSLKDFLPGFLNENYLSSYADFLQEQFQRGKVFLLFDGLDEIPDAALRIKIVRQLELFVQAYPENHFIVTSRIVGYKEARLAAEFQEYTLADFDEVQIKTFTQKWCPAYEYWVKESKGNQYLYNLAIIEAERLFDATQRNPGVKRLAVNPLLLTILALIQRQGIDLPSHRIELFDLCATTLLDTWVKERGVSEKERGLSEFAQFSRNDLIKILCPLAFWMHEHGAVGAIPEEELTAQIVRQLLKRKIARYEDEATKIANQFLRTVRGKTGILIERGKHRYGFLHLTFEEYFAAGELVVRKKDRQDFIKDHLHDPRWREVILLAIGTIGILQHDEEGVTELVQDAILEAESPFEKWLHRDLLFAGLCLADDTGISIACKDEIVERIAQLYLTSPHNLVRNTFSTMLTTWRGTQTAEEISSIILPLLLTYLKLDGTVVSSSDNSLLSNNIFIFCQNLLQRYREVQLKLRYLYIAMISHHQRDGKGDCITDIQTLLIDSNTAVRGAAASALGQVGVGQPQVIESLLKALTDPYDVVRGAAASALGQVGVGQPEVIEPLLKALSDSNAAVRGAAVSELGQVGIGQPQVIEPLLKALIDSDAIVKAAAVGALGQVGIGHPEVIEPLLKALSDSDAAVRGAAASALGQVGVGQPEVVELLLKALSDSDAAVRGSSAGALDKCGVKQSHIVDDLLREPLVTNIVVRGAAITALGQVGVGHPKVIEPLLKAFKDSDAIVKATAASALGRVGVGHPEVIEPLLKALTDSNSSIRGAAANALGQVGAGHPQVIDALLKALSDPTVRWPVANALGQVGAKEPQVIDALLKALSDSDSSVKWAAITALGQAGVGQPQVIDALLKALSTSGSAVREAAITALGQVGVGQPQVIDALLKAISSPALKETAITALGLVDNGQPQVRDALLKELCHTDSSSTLKEAAFKALRLIYNRHPDAFSSFSNSLVKPAMSDMPDAVIDEDSNRFTIGLIVRAIRLLEFVSVGQPRVIDTLLKLLSDSNAAVRVAATSALGQVGVGHSEVLEALLRALSNSDVAMREAAVSALGQAGVGQIQVLEALLKALSDPYSYAFRGTIDKTLSQVSNGQPQMIDPLLKALSGTASNSPIRGVIVRALHQAGNRQPEVIEPLLKALADSDAAIRKSAVSALGQLGVGQPQVIEPLLKALTDSDSAIRGAAASALGQVGIGQPEVIEPLLEALSGSDASIRGAAASALGQVGVGQPQVIESLLEALANSNVAIRGAVVSALGQVVGVGQPQVIEPLLKALKDPNAAVRKAAMYALVQVGVGQPQVIEPLLEALRDSNAANRGAAASALGQVGVGQPQVIESLLEALRDSDTVNRGAAASALGQVGVGQPEVIEPLLEALRDSDAANRGAVVSALGQVGIGQPQVIEPLLKMLTDSDAAVRGAVARALSQVGVGQPQVIEPLFQAIFDSNPPVRAAAVTALTTMRNDPEIVGLRIDKMLQKYEPTVNGQFEADDTVDTLLFTLQQVVEEA